MLTESEVGQYWRDGYLFPVPVMDRDEAATWRAQIESFERRWRHDPTLPEPFENYLRANLHVVSTVTARLAAHTGIVDAVSSILGDDVLCWMAELIVKEPYSDKILTVHQDLTYWGLDGADGLVTAWLALSPAHEENGAMRFVTGSHRLGQAAHRDTYGPNNLLSRGQEVSVDYDPADEAVVELNPGQMSLHHGHMFHGSGPNTSDERRVGMVLRYVSPAVGQKVASHDYGLLVRGVNRTTNLITVAPPTADFEQRALALHREIGDAQEQALAQGATDEFGYVRGVNR